MRPPLPHTTCDDVARALRFRHATSPYTLYICITTEQDGMLVGEVVLQMEGQEQAERARFWGSRFGTEMEVQFDAYPPVPHDDIEWLGKPWRLERHASGEVLLVPMQVRQPESGAWREEVWEFEFFLPNID